MCIKSSNNGRNVPAFLYAQLIILWNAREGWLDRAALDSSVTRIWFQRLAPEWTRAVALHLRTYAVGRLRSTDRGWKRTCLVRLAAYSEQALDRETGSTAPMSYPMVWR
jgi:hypothetical protein